MKSSFYGRVPQGNAMAPLLFVITNNISSNGCHCGYLRVVASITTNIADNLLGMTTLYYQIPLLSLMFQHAYPPHKLFE